jgi:signal transduction histidine kinase
VRTELRAFFREPGPERPPGASAWDKRLAVALVGSSAVEGLLRSDLTGRPVQIAAGVVIAACVAFRRARPLSAVLVTFGVATALTLASLWLSVPQFALWTSICALLMPYALVRWGSGREIVIGYAVIATTFVTSALAGEMHEVSDVIGGAVTLLFPGALGASVRFRAESHRRAIEHAKVREREQIARDLHDSVAHHVSAIAIQAQAGRAVLALQPEATARALEAIEGEASRTLQELRAMVRTLRDERGVVLEPQHGVDDIERLGGAMHDGPEIVFDVDPALRSLGSSVQSALYRIAQESITNAVRHARGATRVDVRIAAEGTAVRLSVTDDGAASGSRAAGGFGLVGMAERVALLRGTFEAGPRREGGWAVVALLPTPREGGASR